MRELSEVLSALEASGTISKTIGVIWKVLKTTSYYLLGTILRTVGSLRSGHLYPLCYTNTETDTHLLISGGHTENW